jgi:hypothetical protein
VPRSAGGAGPPVVVLGLMTKLPVAGVVWQTLHYLLGLRRLGYEPYYVEAHRSWPFSFFRSEDDDGWSRAAAWLHSVLAPFDLGRRWAYRPVDHPRGGEGLSAARLRQVYRDAAVLLNLHGGTEPHAELAETGKLVYLETDPVRLQVELAEQRESTIRFLEPHVAFFTFAERYGRPGCGLPVSGDFPFKPTRQPVVLDLWEPLPPRPEAAFTTVASWNQRGRDVVLDGVTYHWSKDREFRRVLTLPRRCPDRFELALSRVGPGAHERLLRNGWAVRDAAPLSGDPIAYRDFIRRSRGEFTTAKDQNVRLRTGWFSDRSATYLAAGRPVVTQDTGFAEHLPTGEGLFAYRDVAEAAAAIDAIRGDYDRHRRGAHHIARHHFSPEAVLKPLLAEVGC